MGWFGRRWKFKDSPKLERIGLAVPILSEVYPILCKINNDFQYALNLQNYNDTIGFQNMLTILVNDLEEFRLWDEKYGHPGLSFFLKDIDNELLQSLESLRKKAVITKTKGGDIYIIGILADIIEYSKQSIFRIEKF